VVQNNIKIKFGEFGDGQDLRLISKPGLRPSGAQGYVLHGCGPPSIKKNSYIL